MGFQIKVGNITKIKCDAIVNSLGTNNSAFGALCRNIVYQSKSKELAKYLMSLTHSKVGDIYLTDSYSLPCQKIINYVTPFRDCDDDNCTELKKAYLAILKYAKEQKFLNICIPFLGTGANGYSDQEAYEAAVDICDDFSEKNNINITLVIYDSKEERNNRYNLSNVYELCSNESVERAERGRFNINENQKYEEILKYNRMLMIRNMEELVPLKRDYSNAFDFIEDYMYENNIKPKVFAGFISRQEMSKLRLGKNLTKNKLYFMMYRLNLSENVIRQIMIIAGFSFSPYSILDRFYLPYLLGGVKKVSPTILLQNYYEKTGKTLI